MASISHPDHYVILSLPETCTAAEVTRRYKVLSMRHHPDRRGDVEVMARINNARDVLTDVTLREKFHHETGRAPPRDSRPPPPLSFGASPFERTTHGPMPQSAPTARKRTAPSEFDPYAEFEEILREPTPPPENRPFKQAGGRKARPVPPPTMRAEPGGAGPDVQSGAEMESEDWWETLVEGVNFDRALTEEEKALADPEIQAMWSAWFE